MSQRLAVIGAGISGCSAAYLTHKTVPNANITIYEKQPHVGGRILTQTVEGTNIELGAAFFNDLNPTIKSIVEAEQLKFRRLNEHANFAVWNGSEIIFRSNKHSLMTEMELLAKYKLSLTRTARLIAEGKRQFVKLHQTAQKAPAEVGELFEAAELDKWYKKPFDQLLLEAGVEQDFIEEAVSPITRTIYSQNADLGGLAGISSLIGVYSGAMYSLVCGNSSLPAHLLDVSEASIQRGTKIEAVEKTASGTYFLHTEKDSKAFDGVFVTAPLEVAGIKFEGVSPPSFAEQTYQMVYRRVVRGVFEPCFLRLEKEADVPSVVLTTKAADPLTQLSIQRIENGEVLVTASSPQPIKDTVFEGMFKARWVTVLEHQWKTAYPQFKPVNKLPPTRIDDGLLYVSAVEHAVATMETSAFSALNAVKLFRQRVV